MEVLEMHQTVTPYTIYIIGDLVSDACIYIIYYQVLVHQIVFLTLSLVYSLHVLDLHK